jgi:hypothetical protein
MCVSRTTTRSKQRSIRSERWLEVMNLALVAVLRLPKTVAPRGASTPAAADRRNRACAAPATWTAKGAVPPALVHRLEQLRRHDGRALPSACILQIVAVFRAKRRGTYIFLKKGSTLARRSHQHRPDPFHAGQLRPQETSSGKGRLSLGKAEERASVNK